MHSFVDGTVCSTRQVHRFTGARLDCNAWISASYNAPGDALDAAHLRMLGPTLAVPMARDARTGRSRDDRSRGAVIQFLYIPVASINDFPFAHDLFTSKAITDWRRSRDNAVVFPRATSAQVAAKRS
jgi:hypothetical protein